MDREAFTEIYPELLKRLDDAQDGIRVETCQAFEIFFTHLPEYWSSSLYPYTIKQLFIHIDDPNTSIQNAVVKVLEKAMHKQTDRFLEVARESETKFQHTILVKNLLEQCVKVRNELSNEKKAAQEGGNMQE